MLLYFLHTPSAFALGTVPAAASSTGYTFFPSLFHVRKIANNAAELSSLMLAAHISPTADLRMAMANCIFCKRPLSPQSSCDQKQVLAFCLALLQQVLATGSVFQSPLLSFIAVRSLTR
jgi:hypothetical protein